MPETRLARTRQTLPAVYQFGDAGVIKDAWFDAALCCIRKAVDDQVWKFFRDTRDERTATWKAIDRG